MMESGMMIFPMERVHTFLQTTTAMKAFFIKVYKRVLASCTISMVISIPVSGRMANVLEKEDIHGKMGLIMMVNGKMT